MGNSYFSYIQYIAKKSSNKETSLNKRGKKRNNEKLDCESEAGPKCFILEQITQ